MIQVIRAASSSGSVEIKITEQDFGALPQAFGSWTITDGDVLLGSHVAAWLTAEAPTGRDGDEAQMEPMDVFAEDIAAGSFTLVATVIDGPVEGLYKFGYLIA